MTKIDLSGSLNAAMRLIDRGKNITDPMFYNHIVSGLYHGYIMTGRLPIFMRALKQTDIIAKDDLFRQRIQELYHNYSASRLRVSKKHKDREKYQQKFDAKLQHVLDLKHTVPYYWLLASQQKEANLNVQETSKLIKSLKHLTA